MMSQILPQNAFAAANVSAWSKYENGIYMAPNSDGDGTKDKPLGSFEKLSGIISEMKRLHACPRTA